MPEATPGQSERDVMEPWPECSCGCGKPVPAYKSTDRRGGRIKGAPATCIKGHAGGPAPIDWSDVVVIAETGCHEFASYEYPPQGYRRVRWNGEAAPIHRMLWERAHGPAGKDHVHHKCENKRCVNLDRLELLTPSEHSLLHQEIARQRRTAA